jgi:hypothetical protein
MRRGSLIGAPIVGVKMVVNDGASHAVDSSDLAFQLGAMLSGERRFGGDRRPDGQRRPPEGGQFPPDGGQFPPNGGQFPPGDFREGGGLTGRLTEQIQNGSMPPASYTMLHPDAVLTDAERQQLLQGLLATLQGSSGATAGAN